jgi:N-acylneuraminate cytidylyltransferase
MRAIAIIPARGGSKRLPRKALADLGGEPLLAWTIKPALASDLFDAVILSTDDDEYASCGAALGAQIAWRPAELATDTASSRDVMVWHLQQFSLNGQAPPEAAMLLQPTSPLRSQSDMAQGLALLADDSLDAATSVVDLSDPRLPAAEAAFWPHRVQEVQFESVLTGALNNLGTAQQKLAFNGAIYAIRPNRFMRQTGPAFLLGRVGLFAMPPERSVDIDTAEDLTRARNTLAQTLGQP